MINKTQIKHFLPISKLGQGAFSTVYKVKRITDGQIYALKKIKMQKLKQKEKHNSLNQIRILASIKSKFIISYKQAFYDHSLNLLCIVMEYANGGDLQHKISAHQKNSTKFQQALIWKAASQILIGLFILHQKGILHRDLKSANVFISNQIYKLGDLNVSKINCQKDQMARTQTGTPYYASPQVWKDQPYDNKCDIWSLGCLLYQMCCLRPPFQGADLDQLFKAVQKGRYHQIPQNYSSQLSFLIKLCLTVNPKQRPSAKQLLQKFSHLREKYIQSYKNGQVQNQNILLNTIRLPFDLKDLSNNLPSAQYFIPIKQQPRTIYKQEQNCQNKQTVLLKNKQNSNKKQQVVAFPQKIIKNLVQSQIIDVKRRPQRPLTSNKGRSQDNGLKYKRPSSAIQINRQKYGQLSQKIRQHKLKPLQKENKLKQLLNRKQVQNKILQDKKVLNCQIKTNNEQQIKLIQKIKSQTPSSRNQRINSKQQILSKISQVVKPQNILIKKINQHQNRCKSSSLQNRKQYIQRNLSQNHVQSSNLLGSKSVRHKIIQYSNQKKNHPSEQIINSQLQLQKQHQQNKNFLMNQQMYQRCRQNSLKKISSLQKKVKFIRQQRKQRKANFQKNKQNASCIIKPTYQANMPSTQDSLYIKRQIHEKIKQNSQVFMNKNHQKAPVYMPHIKNRQYNIKQLNNLHHILNPIRQNIQKNLQNRRKNLSTNRSRFIASAQSKRVKSFISGSCKTIQDVQHDFNDIKQQHYQRKFGIIRKIPSNIFPTLNCSAKSKNQIQNQRNQQKYKLIKPYQVSNIIQDNQTIMRLKKRIKNRMISSKEIQQKIFSKKPFNNRVSSSPNNNHEIYAGNSYNRVF